MVYLLEACRSCGCVFDPSVLNAPLPRCPKCDSSKTKGIGVVEEQDLTDFEYELMGKLKDMRKEKKLE